MLLKMKTVSQTTTMDMNKEVEDLIFWWRSRGGYIQFQQGPHLHEIWASLRLGKAHIQIERLKAAPLLVFLKTNKERLYAQLFQETLHT